MAAVSSMKSVLPVSNYYSTNSLHLLIIVGIICAAVCIDSSSSAGLGLEPVTCACTTADCIAAGADICRSPRLCYSRLKLFNGGSLEPLEKGCVMDAVEEVACRLRTWPATDSDGAFLLCCSGSWCNSNLAERLPTLPPAAGGRAPTRLPIPAVATGARTSPTSATDLSNPLKASAAPTTAAADRASSAAVTLPHGGQAAVTAALSQLLLHHQRRPAARLPISRSSFSSDAVILVTGVTTVSLGLLVAAVAVTLLVLLARRRRLRQRQQQRRQRRDQPTIAPEQPELSRTPSVESLASAGLAQFDLHYRNCLAEQLCSPLPARTEAKPQN